MANHLDLEEQEQLDEIKHFWKQYGNAITWVLIVVLGAFAAWNGYQYWQRNQAAQAAAMFDEVEKVSHEGDTDKLERAFGDMKDRFASTTYAPQAGLLVAKTLYEAGKLDAAKAALTWVAEKSKDAGYASVGRLRLAGLLIDAKAYDEALKVLDSGVAEEFAALQADRRGDIYMAQGKKAEAKEQYLKAYKLFDAGVDYRRLVVVKLNSLGVDPQADESTKASVAGDQAAAK
ncbi:tetratricopeptide repeat protein [Rhodoferax sp. GW822-FHT02A01]|uniref:YfgM family protein n=1 Tax=Rhodoferax sp. GW822-FHT02A01 TaxID=3141537 RepID=UPI00315D229E